MSTVCGRPQGGGGVRPMWTHVDRGRGVKSVIFCGRHKWMATERTTAKEVTPEFVTSGLSEVDADRYT